MLTVLVKTPGTFKDCDILNDRPSVVSLNVQMSQVLVWNGPPNHHLTSSSCDGENQEGHREEGCVFINEF